MKLVWTRQAHSDRKKIREYILQHAPAAALALDELFSEKASLLHVARQWPPRYTKGELLDGLESSGACPLPPEEREWVEAPSVGREWPAEE